MLKSYSTIFLLCITCASWNIAVNAQFKYPPRWSITLNATELWSIKEHPELPCRAEDGYHKCNKTRGNTSVEICIIRPKVEQCINSSAIQLKCNDNEFETPSGSGLFKSKCIPRNYYEYPPVIFIICRPDEFRCLSSKKCIPRSWVQDGVDDCLVRFWVDDRSDEQSVLYCDELTEHRCHGDSTRCITRQMVMDGQVDCPNGTDEINPLTCHNETEFLCASDKRCILRRYVNDNFSDCTDGTDENVRNFTCIDHLEFTCTYNRCIPRKWVGNGVEDCSEGEDETEMLSTCFDEEFGCLDQSRCLPKAYLCDAVQNCRDGSDEIELCEVPTMARVRKYQVLIPWTLYLYTGLTEDIKSQDDFLFGFKCHIDKKHKSLRSSENNGKITRPETVPQFYLQQNHSVCSQKEDVCFDEQGRFVCARCFDGTVISTSQICDGLIDCRDLSDECTCETSRVEELCEIIYLRYEPEGRQFDLDVICNGNYDMENGLDEKFCLAPEEKPGNFSCYRQNVGLYSNAVPQLQASFCDGNMECPLMEDECTPECIMPFLMNVSSDRTERLEIMRTCFPSLTVNFETNEILDTFPTLLLTTQLNYSTNTEDGSTNSSSASRTCEYRLEQSLSGVFLFEIKNQAACFVKDNVGSTQRGLMFPSVDVLCRIHNVACPWLHFCKLHDGQKIEISLSRRCDCVLDCDDQSDEMNCSRDTHFYCKSGKPLFIQRYKVADGRSDCEDRSDECGEDAFSSATQMIKSVFLRYYLFIASICIIVTNGIVILKHFRKLNQITSKKSLTFWSTTLLINLAFSDAIFGLNLLVLGVKSQQFSGEYCTSDLEWRSSLTCSMIGIFTVISSQTSMNIMVLMTGLRLYTTYKPFMGTELNMELMILLSFLSWEISALVALIPIWSDALSNHSAYIERNLFLNDQIVERSQLEKYISRSGQLFTDSNYTVEHHEFTSLKDWFFNTDQGRKEFPNRHVDVKGYFGFYSSSAVCFPDLYSTTSPSAEYSLFIILYNLLSLVLICIGYTLIFRGSNIPKSSLSNLNVADKSYKKMMTRIMIIIFTDMLCWLPIICMSIISYFGYRLPNHVHALSSIVFLPINSFLNPVIFSRIHRPIKKGMTSLFGPLCNRCRNGNRVAAPSTVTIQMQRISNNIITSTEQ